ncbi:alpha-E domain-containing protein [soil metagenome]
MLLSRVAGAIYWAARYVERAEDTCRIVRAHGETSADMPSAAARIWKPLITVVGSEAVFDTRFGDEFTETAVVTFLMSDPENSGSVVSCVTAARENLRTTRETLPREAWQALNDLYHYVGVESDRGVDRRSRERFLGRVIGDSRRLDGVLATAMTHDEAYAMWRLGRALERADMTTRVLGVRAAAVLAPGPLDQAESVRFDDLQWMGVLKSLAGLQMYQRAVRGPITGPAVVRFLLEHDRFPRAVRALLREVRRALGELPDPTQLFDVVDEVDAMLRESVVIDAGGAELDHAMDKLQVALAQIGSRITERYLRVGS